MAMQHFKISFVIIVIILAWMISKREAANQTSPRERPRRSNLGCYFHRKQFANRESKHIGFGEMPYCMKCTCLSTKILCVYGTRSGRGISRATCKGKKACKKAAKRLSKECPRDVRLNCFTSPPKLKGSLSSKPWVANSCRYFCRFPTNEISKDFIEKPWCQLLSWSQNCAVCPGKKKYMQRNKHLLATCEKENLVINRGSLCNGLTECPDRSDERNCTTYHCRIDIQELGNKRFLWNRTAVNLTKTLDCRQIDSHWRGVVTRSCVYKKPDTKWTKVDLCQCRYTRPDPIEMGSENHTANMILMKTSKVEAYAKVVVDFERPMELGLFLVEKAIALDTADVSRTTILKIRRYLVNIQGKKAGCKTPEAKEKELRLFQKINDLNAKFGMPRLVRAPFGQMEWYLWYKSRFTYQDQLFLEDVPFPGVIDVDSIKETPRSRSRSRSGSMDVASSKEIYERGGFKNQTLKTNLTAPTNITDELHVDERAKKKAVGGKQPGKTSSIHEKILYVMDIVFGVTSVVALSVAVAVMCLLDVPATTKLFIHKNLFVALLITYLVYITATLARKSLSENRHICTAFVVVQYYFSLARYSWMTVEGVNLFIVIVVVFQPRNKKHLLYAVAGWGTPLIQLFIAMAIQSDGFFESTSCLTLHMWIYKGPIAVLLGANVVLFVTILWMVLRKSFSSPRLDTSPQRLRSSVKAFVTLVPLLGICQILGFAIEAHKIIFSYLYIIINGSLGLLFTYLHCFQDSQIQEAVKKFRERRRNKIGKALTVRRSEELARQRKITTQETQF